jgi:hypothetical protein
MHRNDDKRPEYKQKLTSIIVEKWSGGKGATAKSYRAWKKLIQSVAIQYGLKDSETAFLIKINCFGFAKEALDIFDPEDYTKPEILKNTWDVLDSHHEELDHVRQDDTYKQWETTRGLTTYVKSSQSWKLKIKRW